MKLHLLVAILLASGCEHKQQQSDPEAPPAPAPAQPSPQPKPSIAMTKPAPQGPIHLSWKLARAADGKSLKLDYEVENKGSAPVWVIDELVTTSNDGMVVLPERVIVRQGPDATTASFVAGYTEQMGHAVAVQPSPVPRELAVGAKLTGTKQVPLPLASWHPYDSMIDALKGAPARAVLEVGWLPKDPPAGFPGWEDVPKAGGGKLHLPALGFVRTQQQLARGDTLEIP